MELGAVGRSTACDLRQGNQHPPGEPDKVSVRIRCQVAGHQPSETETYKLGRPLLRIVAICFENAEDGFYSCRQFVGGGGSPGVSPRRVLWHAAVEHGGNDLSQRACAGVNQPLACPALAGVAEGRPNSRVTSTYSAASRGADKKSGHRRLLDQHSAAPVPRLIDPFLAISATSVATRALLKNLASFGLGR